MRCFPREKRYCSSVWSKKASIQPPQTARTAGRSGRAGAFTTPALSPAFLHIGPAPCPRTRRPRIFVQTGENSLIPLLGLFPPNPLPLGFGGSPLVSRCRPQFASKTLFGTATLPSPSSGHTAAHRGKQRGNSWRCLFLCIAYQFLIWVSFQNTHQRRTPGSPERVTGCSSICFHL